jgi:hypothetical protein
VAFDIDLKEIRYKRAIATEIVEREQFDLEMLKRSTLRCMRKPRPSDAMRLERRICSRERPEFADPRLPR